MSGTPSVFLATLLNVMGIGLMLFCLFNAFQLKNRVPGGILKKKLDFLVYLIIFFSVGYLVPPFLYLVPEELRPVLVGGFSIFGAIYVIISVKLIDQIILALAE